MSQPDADNEVAEKFKETLGYVPKPRDRAYFEWCSACVDLLGEPIYTAFQDGPILDAYWYTTYCTGSTPEGAVKFFVERLKKRDNSYLHALLEHLDECVSFFEIQKLTDEMYWEARKYAEAYYESIKDPEKTSGDVDRPEFLRDHQLPPYLDIPEDVIEALPHLERKLWESLKDSWSGNDYVLRLIVAENAWVDKTRQFTDLMEALPYYDLAMACRTHAEKIAGVELPPEAYGFFKIESPYVSPEERASESAE